MMLERRSQIAGVYGELLADLAGVSPLAEPRGVQHSWFVYAVRFASRELRDRAEHALELAGVRTARLFAPIPQFPAYRQNDGQSYPQAEAAYDTCLALPLYVDLSERAVAEIVAPLRATCASTAKLSGGPVLESDRFYDAIAAELPHTSLQAFALPQRGGGDRRHASATACTDA
jgi:dTDP-4-amino-4,6-dideoxygalactose transaminase